MLNVGLFEFVFFLSFALIFLGPEKLVELLKSVFQFYHKLKRVLQRFQSDVERELKLNELQQTLESEIDKVRDLERILSQKIYTELQNDSPVHVSLPYSSLGSIRGITISSSILVYFRCPYSYSAFNTNLLRSSFAIQAAYS